MVKKVLIGIGVVAIVSALVGTYFFFKKPADIRDIDPEMALSADELVEAFANEEEATARLVGKVIAVKGVIASVENDPANPTIFLESSDPMSGVTCNFYPEESISLSGLQPGATVQVKGLCTGKLADVVVAKCSLIEN